MDPSLRDGVFFNDNFSMENYFNRYGEYMLNFGSKITTFSELQASKEYKGSTFIYKTK